MSRTLEDVAFYTHDSEERRRTAPLSVMLEAEGGEAGESETQAERAEGGKVVHSLGGQLGQVAVPVALSGEGQGLALVDFNAEDEQDWVDSRTSKTKTKVQRPSRRRTTPQQQ
jgi:hypothetical protein